MCGRCQDKVTYNENMSGSDEDDHDAYMERMKAEGKEKDVDYVAGEEDDDDESDGESRYSHLLLVWAIFYMDPPTM